MDSKASRSQSRSCALPIEPIWVRRQIARKATSSLTLLRSRRIGIGVAESSRSSVPSRLNKASQKGGPTQILDRPSAHLMVDVVRLTDRQRNDR